MFCFHKYGEVKDRYQYCIKCNKAIVVPCVHKWKTSAVVDGFDTTSFSDRPETITKVLECVRCGKVRSEIIVDNRPNYSRQ